MVANYASGTSAAAPHEASGVASDVATGAGEREHVGVGPRQAISDLVGPRRYNRAKLEAYECGIEPSPQPVIGGGRVPIAYYLTAMLFILFDIEMVFLYPFAVSADALGLFGLVEIVLFIVTVGFAYIYVWRRGGLDWN